MKHYGLATFFPEPKDFTDKVRREGGTEGEMEERNPVTIYHSPLPPSLPQDFVFQYEVKIEEALQCGGAYVKLLLSCSSLPPFLPPSLTIVPASSSPSS